MQFPGDFHIMAIASQIETVPAYEYEDGKKTDRQRRNSAGQPLFSLRGCAPFVGGELISDGTVHLTSAIEKKSVRPGALFPVKGTFTPRPATGWGMTGTLAVSEWIKTGEGEKK